MLNFLRKDLLLQLRDYRELALLLLMPVILIAILGLALGGLMTSGNVEFDIRAALVDHDSSQEAAAAFRADLASRTDIPAIERAALALASATVSPRTILDEVLYSDELAGLITVSGMTADEAAAAVAAGEVEAVITVPEDFSRATMGGMLLGESGGVLRLEVGEESLLSGSIVRDVLEGFAREVSFQSALSRQLQMPPPAATEVDGGVETFPVAEGVGSSSYYTLSMAVMFALFVAGSISSRAFLEHVSLAYDRILISGASPRMFLLSKTLTSTIVVFLQMAFLFLASFLLLGGFRGEDAQFWVGVAVAVLLLGLNVGALAALLTAVNFRAGNKGLSDAFSSVIVFVLATLGGSFFPTDQLPDVIGQLGQWTPNGAALNSMLAVAQGAPLGELTGDFMRMLIVAAVLLVVAFAVFRRQGDA